MKRYAVIGNPVGHSRSPFIHQHFAMQTGIALEYGRIQAAEENYADTVRGFFEQGGLGLNVTVPFKEAAWRMADRLSARARLAGAVNTLWMEDGLLHGCNTDGVGLVGDIERIGVGLRERRVLLLGAGGAARGVLAPLLETGCARLHIANRNPLRAGELRARMAKELPQHAARLTAGGLDELDARDGQWDAIINATSSSLGGGGLALPDGLYAPGALAYDMMYGALPTAFLQQARGQGATLLADGLGMLVGQAAASFVIWHGVQPEVAATLAALRQELHRAAPPS
ncbi:shikimate dehydrogenase [Candidimonas humi]|uniref:Shikimate dehydrogenase (NADP(+)) n=1 Tax=Candidimonas humi TaxID=683355 RepID=A0ABV8P353_9BURK|nr:shikimate dehydrogenase [Candidimonas humi]MBV6305360.1 shikimate dehydrogenase [Candidimonas humi]